MLFWFFGSVDRGKECGRVWLVAFPLGEPERWVMWLGVYTALLCQDRFTTVDSWIFDSFFRAVVDKPDKAIFV